MILLENKRSDMTNNFLVKEKQRLEQALEVLNYGSVEIREQNKKKICIFAQAY